MGKRTLERKRVGIAILALGLPALLLVTACASSPPTGEVEVINAEPWMKVSDVANFFPEGPAFDRNGNLYLVQLPTGTIYRITPDKEVSIFFKDPGILQLASIDIHKDGRLFCTTLGQGSIIAVAPDGESYTEIVKKSDLGIGENATYVDDMVFTSTGAFYFDDMSTGNIYYCSSDLRTVSLVIGPEKPGPGGVYPQSPNRISLVYSPLSRAKESRLLIGDFFDKTEWYIDLDPKDPTKLWAGGESPVSMVAQLAGSADSNEVDADGNVYQCLVDQGIQVLKANTYETAAWVKFAGPEASQTTRVTNLTFKPNTDEVYAVVGLDAGGAAVYKFKGLAKAKAYYSMQ